MVSFASIFARVELDVALAAFSPKNFTPERAPKSPCSDGSASQWTWELVGGACCAAELKDSHWLNDHSVYVIGYLLVRNRIPESY